MTERRRWILRWILAIAVVVVLTAGSLWRVATSRDVVDSVPLSTGQYNIRFLKADVGTLRYSSDDRMRAFLRPRLPGALVKRLGEVTTVSGFTASQPEHGEPPLILLFQLLTPQDGLQNNTATVFGKIEFPESTGFVFEEEINGYSSHGQGTSLHQFDAFPRRERTLRFRLYEQNGQLLMEKAIPNPGYVTGVEEWTPGALPQMQQLEDMRVTVESLSVDQRDRSVRPKLQVESSDESWRNPNWSHCWSDATGNVGWRWLSPFEPAWKLHLRLHRRRDAPFPESVTWNIDGLSVPDGMMLTDVDQQKVVDGIGLRVRYVAPAAEIVDEGGTITLKPPRQPGTTGLSISSGSSGVKNRVVRRQSIETGMPFIRVDHDPLPTGVELFYRVRDEHGKELNNNLRQGSGGVDGASFDAVHYAPGPETKTLSLEVRVSRPRDLEFVVSPPAELREGAEGK